MRKLIYISISLLWIAAFTACQEHLDDTPAQATEGLSVDVAFKVNIEPSTILARSNINENELKDMYLLVFDENGLFIKRAKAELQQSGTTTGTFKATLSESRENRTIHFISNYDWNGFNDRDMLGKHENTMIPGMQSNGDMLFWNRTELNNGIYKGCMDSKLVQLIRNMAKITVKNEDSSNNFKNASFAVYNKPDKGTAVPFNPKTGSFTQGSYVTLPGGTITLVNDNYFVPTNGIESSYVYEKDNSDPISNNIYLFVIIKGEYMGRVYYYKLIILDNTSLELMDIYRNYHYKVTIVKVGGEGYSSLDEAIKSPANNNMSIAVDIADYPSISDEHLSLEVETTDALLSHDDELLELSINCHKVSDGSLANNEVRITIIEEDPSRPVFSTSPSYNPATGKLTITGSKLSDDTRTATIRVIAGSLRRDISVNLMRLFKFGNIRFNPNSVGNYTGATTKLIFTIPKEVEKYLPVNCYITANGLTVDDSRLEIVSGQQGWKYMYKITAAGEHSIGFKTNSSNSAEAARVSATYMEDAFPSYRTTGSSTYKLNDIYVSPERIPIGLNQEVTLNFICATPGDFYINTEFLGPAAGQSNITSDGTNRYRYTAQEAGPQSIRFKTINTRNGNTKETLTITAAQYEPAEAYVKNLLINFKGRITEYNDPLHKKRNRVLVSTSSDYVYGIVGMFYTDQDGYFNTLIEAPCNETLRVAIFWKNLYETKHMIQYNNNAKTHSYIDFKITYDDFSNPGTYTQSFNFETWLPFVLSTGRMVAYEDSSANNWAEAMGVNTTYNNQYYWQGVDYPLWSYAKKGCSAYRQILSGDLQDDLKWRLPTEGELLEIYNNRHRITWINNSAEYWSSSPQGTKTNEVRIVDFNTGYSWNKLKTQAGLRTRCVMMEY